ncbi:hypothetical protein [Cellulosimicrobium funkei]|uniref:hypothetical protein n=1 Tax=Cellulosimicrobium funkei TaxID=264251 RepID=UPI00367DDC40
MRTRAGIAVGIVVVGLVAGCSEASTPEAPSASTVPEPPVEVEASPTSSGPSSNAIVRSLADSWGKLSDADRAQMCADIETLGSPASISAVEIDAIMDDYCLDY